MITVNDLAPGRDSVSIAPGLRENWEAGDHSMHHPYQPDHSHHPTAPDMTNAAAGPGVA